MATPEQLALPELDVELKENHTNKPQTQHNVFPTRLYLGQMPRVSTAFPITKQCEGKR